jgi:coenzyme F420-0:L-glutamate ligase/coenzyme F420-1:gamma-L-glutamate ligase
VFEMAAIQVMGVEGLPIVRFGDDLGALICEATKRMSRPVMDGDVVVVTHVVVSKAEGSVVNLDGVQPSEFALNLASRLEKDPALVEVVLRESRGIRRIGDGVLITETKHGFVCANSGVDRSNVSGERSVALLPADPDASAIRIREQIRHASGRNVAVIVSDTHGRPFRMGEINVAIGVAGLKPIRDRRGEKDLFGYILRVKQTAVADELAAAAELVIGQADEGVPAAIIRGYRYLESENAKATELVRLREKDLFI